MSDPLASIHAIDLFCGVGGLSQGLRDAGIRVVAGVDVDEECEYPFTTNIEASFLPRDVSDLTGEHLASLWGDAPVRLLAGCAPCQPFSPYRRGIDTTAEKQWPLMREFGRLVSETLPELVTMENVPRIGSSKIFQEFVALLKNLGYDVDWRSCNGLRYGLAQTRRRLVLVASLLGPVSVPVGAVDADDEWTVRDVIADLPGLDAGQVDADDTLHRSRSLAEINLKRIRASSPGGTWEDWPEELRAPCHRKASGASFRNVYARMEWDKPSPTITTLFHNFGTGRFGHPEQDRPISLREAAMLQGFPRGYKFVRPQDPVHFSTLGRLIGNAVPPPLARAVGEELRRHVDDRHVSSLREQG
ncbi:MAG TPA: DNA cytosine methyltransferase [Solirubrobacteraceae bacterium]|jgi:DNA (cytosine-5)-methyltransferase 1